LTLIFDHYPKKQWRVFNADGFTKNPKGFFSSFRRKPESKLFVVLFGTWTPFFNGVTKCYESILDQCSMSNVQCSM